MPRLLNVNRSRCSMAFSLPETRHSWLAASGRSALFVMDERCSIADGGAEWRYAADLLIAGKEDASGCERTGNEPLSAVRCSRTGGQALRL